MKSKMSPLTFGVLAVGGFLLVRHVVMKKAEQDAIRGFARLFEPASGTVVPAGKTWLVTLKNGDVTQMSSAQLQNAIDAKAVKSAQVLTTQQV